MVGNHRVTIGKSLLQLPFPGRSDQPHNLRSFPRNDGRWLCKKDCEDVSVSDVENIEQKDAM